MARCRVEGLDDVTMILEKLARDADKIAKLALIEGGRVLKANTSVAIISAATRGYATGELAGSLELTAPEKNAYGWFVVVRPTGTDSKGVRNGAKWGYLQHGNGKGSTKHDFKSAAVAASEGPCKAIAERVLEEHAKI